MLFLLECSHYAIVLYYLGILCIFSNESESELNCVVYLVWRMCYCLVMTNEGKRCKRDLMPCWISVQYIPAVVKGRFLTQCHQGDGGDILAMSVSLESKGAQVYCHQKMIHQDLDKLTHLFVSWHLLYKLSTKC